MHEILASEQHFVVVLFIVILDKVVLVLFYIVLPFEPSVFHDRFFFYKMGQDLQSCPMSR